MKSERGKKEKEVGKGKGKRGEEEETATSRTLTSALYLSRTVMTKRREKKKGERKGWERCPRTRRLTFCFHFTFGHRKRRERETREADHFRALRRHGLKREKGKKEREEEGGAITALPSVKEESWEEKERSDAE